MSLIELSTSVTTSLPVVAFATISFDFVSADFGTSATSTSTSPKLKQELAFKVPERPSPPLEYRPTDSLHAFSSVRIVSFALLNTYVLV